MNEKEDGLLLKYNIWDFIYKIDLPKNFLNILTKIKLCAKITVVF